MQRMGGVRANACQPRRGSESRCALKFLQGKRCINQVCVTVEARMPCVTKMSLQLLLPLPPPPLASAPATADGAIATAIAAVTVVAAVNAAVAADAPRCPLPHLPLPPLTQVLPAPVEADVASETVYCKQQERRERGGGVQRTPAPQQVFCMPSWRGSQRALRTLQQKSLCQKRVSTTVASWLKFPAAHGPGKPPAMC